LYRPCRGVPQSSVSSVGFLWGSLPDRGSVGILWGSGRMQMTWPSHRPDSRRDVGRLGTRVTHRDECQGAILARSPILGG
jgi:hypothetical protein